MTHAEEANPLTREPAPRAGGPRVSRGVIETELRRPLEAVARSLQRLSLQDVGDSTTGHIVRRGRALMSEMLDLVAELTEAATPGPGPVPRVAQQRVDLRALVEDAAAEVAAHFDRRIDVEVPKDIAATTDPTRVRAILVNVLAAATRSTEDHPVRVDATFTERVLRVTIEWLTVDLDRVVGDGDPGLALAGSLARSLGGDLDSEELDGWVRVSLRLPQQRTGDPAR